MDSYSDNTNLFVRLSSFVSNFGGCGGAIYLSDTDAASLCNCSFTANVASRGSGSAVWLSASSGVSIAGNNFSANQAPSGGGTVYWEVSEMTEPFRLSSANTFLDNFALYGSLVATDAMDLKLDDGNNYYVTDYSSPIPPVNTYVVDYYKQVVKTESGTDVFASTLIDNRCFESIGYVTGDISEEF